jgi:hypothetical protein
MGLLDAVVDFFAGTLRFLDDLATAVLNPDMAAEQASDVVVDQFDAAIPNEITATFVDSAEEFILQDLQDEGEIVPGNPQTPSGDVEDIADSTEGRATTVLTSVGLVGPAIEAAGLGQLETHQEVITQAFAALGIDDVTGLELDARIAEGIQPAWTARAGKEHRAKFVDLQDAIELLLRNKTGDSGYVRGQNVDSGSASQIRSNAPVNPDNLIEEWGIRDDQLPILEEVALNAMEFEELIETPAELGLVPPQDVVDAELDRSGYAEDTKDFLRRIRDRIKLSNRAWQEFTEAEALIGRLEPLARKDEVNPDPFIDDLPSEVDPAKPALKRRMARLESLPPGTPTGTDAIGSWALGFTDLRTLEDRLDRVDYETAEYPDLLDVEIASEIDGDLQRALAVGRISSGRYGQLMDRLNLPQEAQQVLMRGGDVDDFVTKKLEQSARPEDRPVASIPGIGQARSTALFGAGIETVGDLAQAQAGEVASAAQVDEQTARGWIDIATDVTSAQES